MERDKEDTRSSVSALSAFNSTEVSRGNDKDGDGYDPFEHRNMKNSNTTIGSFAHLLKSSLGSGIFSMPMAFKNSGILFGALGTLMVGFICTHCVHVFVRTSHEICRKSRIPSLNFSETVEKAFENGPPMARRYAPLAKAICDYGMVATYFGVCCLYIVLIASSFQDVINYRLDVDWDVRYYIAVTVLPCIILGEIRKLKYLVPFSAVANVCIFLAFAITLYYIFSGDLNISERPSFSSWERLPMFFSTVVFAMEGIGVVMPVENQMKKPQHFLGCPGVLNTTMGTVAILYGVIGFLGYLRYGEHVKGSITLNLPPEELLSDTVQFLIGVAIFFTFGLQFFVPMDILWSKMSPSIPIEKHNIVQIVFRAVSILMMGAVAAAVPELEPFIGLIGAVFLSFLGLFIPAMVETVFRYSENNLGYANWIMIKNGFLMVFAVLVLATGSYTSFKGIIKFYQQQ